MAFIATAAVISGGLGYLSSSEQSKGARKAAQISADAQERMFNRSREDMAPWRDVGQGALFSMADLMGIDTYAPAPDGAVANKAGLAPGQPEGTVARPRSPQFGSFMDYFGPEDFVKDPGYDFRLREGIKALDRSAAARGNLFSGSTGKALAQYGQDYGSNEFMNAYNRWNSDRDRLFNRLSGIAGTGQTSAGTIGNWGISTGQNVGNTLASGITGAANARASGYNAIGNSALAGGNAWMQYQGMKNPAPAPTPYNNGQPYFNPEGW